MFRYDARVRGVLRTVFLLGGVGRTVEHAAAREGHLVDGHDGAAKPFRSRIQPIRWVHDDKLMSMRSNHAILGRRRGLGQVAYMIGALQLCR
jgi:hypothetical protein